MRIHLFAIRRQGMQFGAYHPLRLIVSARIWKAAAYLILSFPLGALWFCMLLFLIALGAGTAIIWVGVLIFGLAMMLWRIGAGIERWRLAVFMDRMIPSPYQPLPAGSWLSRIWTRARDIAIWRDLLYLLLLFPLGIVDLISVFAGVIAPVSLITMPLYFAALPKHAPTGFSNLWSVLSLFDSLPKALLAALIGIPWLILGQYLIVGMAHGHATVGEVLLRPARRKQAELEARIASLRESRSQIIDAGVSDRQQIERDLHDGAQQRLISLALHLGMAKAKLATDPAAAQALVAEAHEEAKQTLAEVRDLVRGIYPPILADRGLGAAISSLASRCPVPVTITTAIEGRLPEVVESTAYFLVAEALTNVAKHSQATEAWVEARRYDDHLLVVVGDNGKGGADPALGTGLAGLSARVAALDGQLTVSSPPQGSTIITGDLPCAS